MKLTTTLLTAAVLALFATSGAWAQASPTREEVKKEAATANKAGTLPKGEVDAAQGKADATKSTKARTEVKAEAKAANKAGIKCETAGPGANEGKSTAARGDVKAEAAKANKAGAIECGEAAPPKAAKK